MLDLTLDARRPTERVSSIARTVPELFHERVARFGHRIAYREKSMGRWTGTSWRTFGGAVALGAHPTLTASQLACVLEVKRKVVEERFVAAFDALYDGGGLSIQ